MSGPGAWERIERGLARLRPHRVPLTLAVDAFVVVVCWNFTYLFRLGFERWWSARPSYDPAVMLGVVVVYVVVLALARVPRGMWRFSGFAEVKRLTLACLAAGAVAAVVVLALQLRAVPRAVLALHPIVALMGLCIVRILYRMLYEHSRARITGSDAQVRRAIVLGAGGAAKRLLAAIHHEGWIVLGLLDDDPAKRDARIAGVAGSRHPGRPLVRRRRSRRRDAPHRCHAGASAGGGAPARPSTSRRRPACRSSPCLRSASFRTAPRGSKRVRNIEPEDLLGRGIRSSSTRRGIGESDRRQDGAGHRRRRLDRVGALPADRALSPSDASSCYELSEFALYQIEQEPRRACTPSCRSCG